MPTHHYFSSVSQIHPSLPTGTAIIKTLLTTFGQLKPKHLYILGLLGWPSPLVTRPPPEQPLHVLREDGTIRMRRAHNVRGGWAPWKPMLGAPYPDHPFQSMKFFKSKILDPLEQRGLLQTHRVPYPLLTPQDHAEALALSLKTTRRRQRDLAATPEIGLGTGFRLKKQAKKEWEDKVYGLEVEREEARGWKDEWVVRAGGLGLEEGELERELERFKAERGWGELQRDPPENVPTSVEDPSFFPPTDLNIPDLHPSLTLPTLLLHPTLIPTHLRPDPRTEPPLPLPPTHTHPTPSLLHSLSTLSHPSLHPRWASAISAEITARKVLLMEERDAELRKAERRKTYSNMREGKRRLKDGEMRALVEGDEGARGVVDEVRAGREYTFWKEEGKRGEEEDERQSVGGWRGDLPRREARENGSGGTERRSANAGSWRGKGESGQAKSYGLRREPSRSIESQA